jgi:hypothetical protein
MMRRRPPRDLAARHATLAVAAVLEQREREQAEWDAAWHVLSKVLWGPDKAASERALKCAAELQRWRYRVAA